MKVLVAGIGNIFFGDDGFGVEVARRLAGCELPEGVVVADYGIRGVHLALELLEGYDALVLVDALAMGEPAGTVVVLEPDMPDPAGRGRRHGARRGRALDEPGRGARDARGDGRPHRSGARRRLRALGDRGGHRPVAPSRRRGRPGGGGGVRHAGRARCRPRGRPRREEPSVIRRLVVAVVLVLFATLVVKSLPDVARYLKMREM